MCYCNPIIRTPCCGSYACHAIGPQPCPWHPTKTAEELDDWATKAAIEIDSVGGRRGTNPEEVKRIASIISAHATPLITLLRESKHLLRHEPGCMAAWAEIGVVYDDKRCTCSVDAWNA